MRRHHFLALQMPSEPPADSISLLIGAQANREQRRSSRISSDEEIHKRLPHLFSPNRPADDANDRDDSSRDCGSPQSRHQDSLKSPEASPNFLGRVGSYNRLMHAHTKAQMDSPGSGAIPTYTRTMHAHTLNQLYEHRRNSRSETNSPQLGVKQAKLPVKVCHGLTKLTTDEVPHAPFNTPEQGERKLEPVVGIDFGKLRRRSLTTPYAARDFALVESSDFAVAPAAV